MTARDNLLQAIQELQDLLSHSSTLNADVPEHRMKAIQLRRQFSKTFGAIAASGNDLFAGSEREGTFRNEFSKMRSAMALHQASWPIVAVNYDDPAYRASEATVRRSSQHFIAWVTTAQQGA